MMISTVDRWRVANYDCPYCPFAKRRDSPEQLRADRAALGRFTDWVTANPDGHALDILFTPWGEGLTRSWYRDAMVHLSHLPQVGRIAIQTNLSCRLDWLAAADVSTVALWATYHPGEVSRPAFVAKAPNWTNWVCGTRSVRSACPSISTTPVRCAANYPSTSTCGSTRPRACPTTPRPRPRGRRSTPCSATASARTSRPATNAGPASRPSPCRVTERCGAVTSSPNRSATCTTARTWPDCAPSVHQPDLRLPHRLRASQATAVVRRVRRWHPRTNPGPGPSCRRAGSRPAPPAAHPAAVAVTGPRPGPGHLRRIVSTAESTWGAGENAWRGSGSPARRSHRSPGPRAGRRDGAANRRTAARCSTRSAAMRCESR